jgi:hypothetical protein
MEEGRGDVGREGGEGQDEGGGMEGEDAALLSENVEEFLRDVTAALGRQRVGACVNLSLSLSLFLFLSLSLSLSLWVCVWLC